MTFAAYDEPAIGGDFELNLPLTVSDLAQETGHSDRSIRRWISDLHIKPAGRVGRANYYWLSDILQAEHDTRRRQLAGTSCRNG